MRNARKGVLGLLVISLCFGVNLPAQADSVGPYYAIPSWDQTLPAATRFIVLSNFQSFAVLDRNTGLVWERTPQTALFTWSTARMICLNKQVGAQTGFRLPSVVEMSSLQEPNVLPPIAKLPPGHPFLNDGPNELGVGLHNIFWTATTDADNPSDALVANFVLGGVGPNAKAAVAAVWCVRGGMNSDRY